MLGNVFIENRELDWHSFVPFNIYVFILVEIV